MRRTTITLPDELSDAIGRFRRDQPVPAPPSGVVQAAIEEYLARRGHGAALGGGGLRITPAARVAVRATSARRMTGASPSAHAARDADGPGRYWPALRRPGSGRPVPPPRAGRDGCARPCWQLGRGVVADDSRSRLAGVVPAGRSGPRAAGPPR